MELLAACHLHSSWSYDGSWTIDALVSAFGQRGYRVLMMTEHDRGFDDARYAAFREACARATSAGVYVLPGIEYSDPENRVHVLVWGAIPFLGEGLTTSVLLKSVSDHGGLAVLAHPARRSAWACVQPAWKDHLLGVEVWNRKYDGWAPSTQGSRLLEGASQAPFVGLDFHTKRQMFPIGMALSMEGAVDEIGVIECLRRRRFGPRAFGLPLQGDRLQRSLSVLKVAEHGRQTLAAIKRYSKVRLFG